MRKIFITVALMAIMSTHALAFLPEIENVTKEEIKKYSDEELVTAYVDAVIERRAREAFHGKAGFAPKEYQSFKDLLLLIVHLRQEIQRRGIEVPPINDWLK